jgi:hypothetical protein
MNRSQDYNIVEIKNFNCLQINLQRSRTATIQLNKTIEEKQCDIVFIQEPYVIKSKVCGFSLRHKLYYKSSNVIKTAILVINPKIQCLFIESLSNHFLTIVKLEFESKIFYGFSLYCSPFESIESELIEVNNALKILKPKNLIICMDSNAKSKVWFNKSDNNRGQLLIDFINQNNLFIINNNDNLQLTTYFTTRGVSNIDLTIIDINSTQFVNNWRICDDHDSMSDHRYLEFKICQSPQTIKYKNTKKYIIRDENWAHFGHKCQLLVNTLKPLIKDISNENEFNHFVNQLSLKLNDICDQSFRIEDYNNTYINNKTNNWWTQDLTRKRRQINRIRRAYQRCQTPNRMQIKYNYLCAREEYKQLLIITKNKSWISFIENNSIANPWGLVYAISKDKVKVESVSELRRSDGSVNTDTKEMASQLLDTLFPYDNIQSDTDFHKILRQQIGDYCEPNDLFFSKIEVTEVINTQNKSKAPGIDGFTADIIKNLHSIDNTFMTNIYNKSLSIGLFPNIWKISCVKVLKKPNKQDYTTAKSYRPISLLSVFAKVLEKLLINRINYYLESKSLLNSRQYGFRPQKSTVDALMNVTNFIEASYDNKGFALLIALDISGAFDNAFWPIILKNLRDHKIPGNLYYLTKSYFEDRKAKLWFQNIEVEKSLSKGCPQGSTCGPGFWSIIYNSLLEIEIPENCLIQGFADDTIFMISGQNQILNLVNDWSVKNELEFNASKTVSVLFTKNIKYTNPKIYLNSTELKISKSMLYLGIKLDSKLNWKIQMNYLKTKAIQLVMNITSFAKNKYGLNRRSLEVIYKGAIIPIISYGSPVWYKALDRKQNQKIFENIQRLLT